MCDLVARMCLHGDYFFFKQKTAYEMRISDWSSDVCSSDLGEARLEEVEAAKRRELVEHHQQALSAIRVPSSNSIWRHHVQAFGQAPADLVEDEPNKWLGTADEIGRAACREECVGTCRSRWAPYH